MVSQPSPVQENAAAVFWASLYSDNVGTPSSICSLAGAKPLSTAGVTSVWVYFPVAYFVWEAVPGSSVEGAAEHPASASSKAMRAASGASRDRIRSIQIPPDGAAAQAAAALAILVIPLYHTKPEKILNAPAALSGIGCAPGEFVL